MWLNYKEECYTVFEKETEKDEGENEQRAEEECWRWKKRNRREKKVEKAGLDPAAAAPSQPDRLDGSRSDHSAVQKNRLRDEL